MRWFLIVFCLLLLIVPVVNAQNESPPIIVLNAGGIYAVSPLDGSVETLVEPPLDYADIREQALDPVTVFSAEWMSPDGQYLAYRRVRGDALSVMLANEVSPPHALFVLDVENGGDPVQLDLQDGGQTRINTYIESVAWSDDGSRLYVAVIIADLATDERVWSLVYYERDVWDEPIFLPLPDTGYAMTRQILPATDGMVILDRGIQSPVFEFWLYDEAGEEVNNFTVDWNLSPDINFYINTPFNPLLVEETLYYGLVMQASDILLFQVDFASGEATELDFGYHPAMVSATSMDTSLRIWAGFYSGDNLSLVIFDADGNYLDETGGIRAYAFGIAGDNVGSTFALAPDGQTIAYLVSGELTLWQDGTTTTLPVTAEALAWGPRLYIAMFASPAG